MDFSTQIWKKKRKENKFLNLLGRADPAHVPFHGTDSGARVSAKQRQGREERRRELAAGDDSGEGEGTNDLNSLSRTGWWRKRTP
jgi:hypothetical protein